MNDFRPTVGIEFDDKYLNARSKVIECLNAISELTPHQRECLAKELMAATGTEIVIEQFLRYMSNGGAQ